VKEDEDMDGGGFFVLARGRSLFLPLFFLLLVWDGTGAGGGGDPSRVDDDGWCAGAAELVVFECEREEVFAGTTEARA
jgi:hypothetical protein